MDFYDCPTEECFASTRQRRCVVTMTLHVALISIVVIACWCHDSMLAARKSCRRLKAPKVAVVSRTTPCSVIVGNSSFVLYSPSRVRELREMKHKRVNNEWRMCVRATTRREKCCLMIARFGDHSVDRLWTKWIFNNNFPLISLARGAMPIMTLALADSHLSDRRKQKAQVVQAA